MVYANKKAISPVVATALLLVVAVVAVVGFQTWFNTYQSGLNVKVEQQSNAGSALTIERLESSSGGGGVTTVYIKNGGTTNVEMIDSKITNAATGATICNLNATSTTHKNATASDVTTINNVSNADTCAITTGNSYGIVIVTAQGVFSATQLAR